MRDAPPPVPRPSRQNYPNLSPWLDEQIWGHRILDQQSPWLLFLEFLTVAEACHRDDKLLRELDGHPPLAYRPYWRMYLRNILFRSDRAFQEAERHANDALAWQAWIASMNDTAQGIDVTRQDFSYLKDSFESFRDFSALVAMLRSSAVESETNRQWSSKFVFPFGPNGLYEDVGTSKSTGRPTRQYINFGRGGELLYLMLCRSSSAEQLRAPVAKMLEGRNRWDRLLGLLQPGPDLSSEDRGGGYLPYQSHSSFDMLGEDWLHVVGLDLPGFDSILHLVTLGAFHVVLYHLALSAQWLDEAHTPYMICEVVAPRRTLIRQLSIDNYRTNDALSERAIAAYVQEIECSDDWQRAMREPDITAYAACRAILEEHVWWPLKDDDYAGAHTPDALMRELKDIAVHGHRQHVAHVHRAYGRDVGLVSKRGTNKLRYAPTDNLLKTLLAANVPDRMEINEFLDRLYERYGLIFGERQASRVISKDDLDKKVFQANAQRLEQRLGSLGMLKRLSDSCAYVVNPYARRTA